MADEPKDETTAGPDPKSHTAEADEEKDRRQVRKIALFAILALGALAAIIISIPRFFEAPTRPPVNRTKADMRTFATALEAYYIDNGCYPAWATGKLGYNHFVPVSSPTYPIPTFRIKQGPNDPLMTLTTPVSYLTTYFPDPWAPDKGATFAYWVPPKGTGWILWSPGPDGVYDIDPVKDYDPSKDVPSESLINKIYDPTNGVQSRGDYIRLKQ